MRPLPAEGPCADVSSVVRPLQVIAAAMAVAALTVPSSASAAAVPARSAASFRDSVGVKTHIVYYDTAYGDWTKIVQKLDDLGIDHLRDGVYANPDWHDWNERYYKDVELAAAHGKKFDFLTGGPNFNAGTLDQLLGIVHGRLRPVAEGLEDRTSTTSSTAAPTG